MGHPSTETKVHLGPDQLYSLTVHVLDRTPHCNRKTSMVRSPPHEIHSVALEVALACPRELVKDYSNSPLSPSTPKLVVKRVQRTPGPTITPSSTRSANVYRRLKRRLGCTLRGLHCKMHLVASTSICYFFGVKSSLAGLQEF